MVEVISEHSLNVFINEELAMKIVCTPINMEEMVIGRLITEKIINAVDDIKYVHLCESGNRIKFFLNEGIKWIKQDIDNIESCCSDNKIYVKSLKDNQSEESIATLHDLDETRISSDQVFELIKSFKEGSELHTKTHGTHSCILAVDGKILFKAEDIGRHNALDKVIGMAARKHIEIKNAVLYTSGRVPVDMLKKAINAEVKGIISNTVPTAEAIELARENNLALICSAREDKYFVFS